MEIIEENPRRENLTAEDLYPYIAQYARLYRAGRKDEAKNYRVEVIEPITGKGAMPRAPTDKEIACPMLLAKVVSCSIGVRDKKKRGEIAKTYKVGKHRVPTVPAAICRATMGERCPSDNPAARHFDRAESGHRHATRRSQLTRDYGYIKGHYRRLPQENPIGDHDYRYKLAGELWIKDNLYTLGPSELAALDKAIKMILKDSSAISSREYERLTSIHTFIHDAIIGSNPAQRRFDFAESGRRGAMRGGSTTKDYGYVKGHYRRTPRIERTRRE